MNEKAENKKEDPKAISRSLRDSEQILGKLCEGCDDILLRKMRLGQGEGIDCLIVYIETAVSNMMLQDSMIGKMINSLQASRPEEIYRELKENSLGISDAKDLMTMDEALAAMLAGNAVFFIDGFDRALKISSKGYPAMGVSKAETEKAMRGSREAFSESVKVNTALVRKRIRDTRLKVKEKMVGEASHTMTAVVYMEGVAYPSMVEKFQERLDSFVIDGFMDSGVIEQLTEDTWYSPFPQFQTTERPDRAAMAVLEGRVVFFSDNSPEAIILPATYNSLFQTSDDYFRHFGIVSFLRIIRYIAAFLAVSLPGLYIAVTNFQTQILPTNLIISLAKAREGVPFPGVLEILLLELSFELLREAGVRMPGTIGNTIGIVGGLIIGQAAVSANIVSPIVVVIVALTALGSFSVPSEELSEAFRLLKYGMILLCSVFGILGLALGWMLVLIHLSGLKSFGIPYLMPFSGNDMNRRQDGKDSIIRMPLWMIRKRPVFARRDNRTKLRWKE
ncbi:spore germination protein [Murimonas intestini]|uniref:Spore germination protein n=1 Tax=Murimonas intestini TaxID=1337051 RepID=A0AB73T3J7_9FIRM|nr:spore germination protein [Murimonas intestini]MCR1841105.1 spore germination protein [Murimonas intestini]MCR1865777.1 spore germination protein [Murimonas intestini]MCR1883197.1 spore germination protein [Murimonas intestini]